jgi:WD40 repeat protein
MPARFLLTAWLLGLLAAPGPDTDPPGAQPARTDLYGDPLPRGAVARIGTVRLRQSLVRCIAFSPDGKALASGGADNKVILWDPATGKQLRSFVGHGESVDAIAFSPDGELLASGSQDREVRVWQTATGRELRRLTGHGGPMFALAWSPDGKRLASGGLDSSVRVWEVSTGKELRCLQRPQGQFIQALAFSPDGKTLAAARANRKIDLWEVATGKHAGALAGHAERVTALAFAPDGKTLFTGSFDTTVRFWDVAVRKERRCLGAVKRRVSADDPLIHSLAVAPDGNTVAAGRQDGVIVVWDATTGKELRRWSTELSAVMALAFSPDGKALASAAEHSIRLWDPATGRSRDPCVDRHNWPRRVVFSPDGKVLAVGEYFQTVRLYDVSSRRERVCLKPARGWLGALAFSPDGRVLAIVETSRTRDDLASRVRLVDVATGKNKGRLPKQRDTIEDVAFSPRGDRLACLCGRELIVWDLASCEERDRFGGRDPGAHWVALSPDGRNAAMATPAQGLSVWDLASGQKIGDSPSHEEVRQTFVVFSPDGRTLACAGGDRREPSGSPEGSEIVLWETATLQERCRLRGHRREVSIAALSPDGRIVASIAAEEGAIRLWDTATAQEIGRLEGHPGGVDCLAFSPDGKVLVSGGADTTLVFWDPWMALAEQKRPARKLDRDPLRNLWADLASPDAKVAYRAIGTLADHAGEAAPFLHRALGTAPTADAQRVARLLTDLDDSRFAVRDKAAAELAELGRVAEPALRRALEARPSLEVRRRVEQLLGKLAAPEAERFRVIRAVEALERMGTAEAREVLRDLEAGHEGLLPEEARAALARLARRPLPLAHQRLP